MIDSFKHKGLRKQLIDSLRRKGIRDERVLQAMESIPRHFFFESSFLSFAYDDKPFPIGAGQTISQPYTVAFQTELLDVKKGEKILTIYAKSKTKLKYAKEVLRDFDGIKIS